MHEIIMDDRKEDVKTNDGKSKDDNYFHNICLTKKFHLHSSPQEESKFLFKHRYVSSSRSVPRRNKRFARCRINRSLNFDTTVHNSSSDSSFDGDKYMTRSAKIMRALNFNSSPSYYGRIKTKRSLNFNLTPSPKRFTRTSRSLPKASSLNFSVSPIASNKILNFDESPSNSANSSLAFTSSESIDENQNETPSQQNAKARSLLSFSTPDARLRRKSSMVVGASPLLRSGLRERIDNIVHISGTPNPQSLKCRKTRLRYNDEVVLSTPRNLLRDFHEEDDNRPRTPENVSRIIPDSMSAIKRSHKKERSSRWRERSCTEHSTDVSSIEPTISFKESNELSHTTGHTSTPQMPRKYTSFPSSSKRSTRNEEKWKGTTIYNSEDDHSDTGSIFDYTEEHKNTSTSDYPDIREHQISEELGRNDPGNWSRRMETGSSEVAECHWLTTEHDDNSMQPKLSGTSNDDVDVKTNERPRTPDPNESPSDRAQMVVTPENRLNILQQILRDSIKKSHKKIKDENKRKLFSPKVLRIKLEDMGKCAPQNEDENTELDMEYSRESEISPCKIEGASTPEKVNSSRLLLSQFSSVKKSHKKDKRNKIISEFMKRQEYFSRDFGFLKNTKEASVLDSSDCKDSTDDSVPDPDTLDNVKTEKIQEPEQSLGTIKIDTFSYELSPSKRIKSLDVSNTFSDIELQECDTSKEEFRIFTPLKRKRSLTRSIVKEYLCPYKVPSDNDDICEETIADIGLSRCLTPVASFQDTRVKTNGCNVSCLGSTDKHSSQENDECTLETKVHDNFPEDLSGRSTPKNMSTAELYCNIDSIKKSHKKNKCASGLRKSSTKDENGLRRQKRRSGSFPRDLETSQLLSSSYPIDPNRDNDRIESSDTCRREDETKKGGTAVDYDNFGPSTSLECLDGESGPSSSRLRSDSSLTKTPPNCLKTKSYIRLLQNTSIKRSHKKVRDQKKYESATETHDLSDDGSIFGDEEKMIATELDEMEGENNGEHDTRRKV